MWNIMTLDKVNLSKHESKQLGRKAIRLVQLNLRFCLLLCLLAITIVLITHLNRSLRDQPKHLSLHQYVRNYFKDPFQAPLKLEHNNSNDDDESFTVDVTELEWSDDTVELFQDQLGVIIDDETSRMKCQLDGEFVVSALPGPYDEDLSDNVWQYISLLALEEQTEQFADSKKLSLKFFVTEQMRAVLNQLFEGLPLQTLSNLPPTCYNLKYAQIIGNKSPINLKENAPTSTLLLDPKAKRVNEIAQLFGSKMRPFFRLNQEIMKEVQQEFLVTKTLQEIEANRDSNVNFIGVYISSEDKLPLEYYQRAMNFHRKTERAVFIFICDLETLVFCQESFDGKDSLGDVRILRKSSDLYDFALLTSCNSTIVSNNMGVLHALLNGGETTVRRPEATSEPEYNVPWLMSEQLTNFYAIE